MTTDSENVYMVMLVDPAASDALKYQTNSQKLANRHMPFSLAVLNVVNIEPGICTVFMRLDTVMMEGANWNAR
jgi:hypothetical protein